MTNVWQGQLVRLRGVEPTDAEIFSRFNLDSERARLLDYAWPPISAEAVREWAREQSLKRLDNDAFFWVIVRAASGEPVGQVSTHNCNTRNGTFAYGIDIARDHRRLGYAREAITLVLAYYFDTLRYQMCQVDIHADNAASIALHDAMGFVHEGRRRRAVYTNGAYVDTVLMSLAVDEFKRGQSPAV